MIAFEKTKHLFGDLIDLENPETGEMVTMPGIVYRYLSGTMPDQEIFDQVLQESKLEEMREIIGRKADALFRNYRSV